MQSLFKKTAPALQTGAKEFQIQTVQRRTGNPGAHDPGLGGTGVGLWV